MPGAQLRRLIRRVQRIRQQKKTIDQSRRFGSKNTRLTPAIRMAGEEHLAVGSLSQRLDGFSQTFPICCCLSGKGRPRMPLLPKRQVTSQHGNVSRSESFGHRHQQGAPAVASRSVGQDKSGNRGLPGFMQVSVDSVLDDSDHHLI
jgi:hypothetical protein